tara:strand:- start:94 stop:684 length:591 start_codon:yes stop_codon:yes gene_type:complete
MKLILRNIPNILTLSRIVLAPVFFMLFMYEYYLFATICFFIASITDALDGFLARRFKLISKFGKLYDPLADKFLVFLSFICIFIYPYQYTGFISFKYLSISIKFILILILFRDILVTVLREQLKKYEIILKANSIGKIKTIMLLISIHSYLLSYVLFNSLLLQYLEVIFVFFMFLALFLSLWSSFYYIAQYRKAIK